MENWIILLGVGLAGYWLGWLARSISIPGTVSAASHEAAEAHGEVMGPDMGTAGRIAAIKRLRALRPDLGLKEAKDAIDLIAARREGRG